MGMKNIMVSGASGIVGYGILKTLRLGKHRYNLIGTTIYENSVAPAFCDIYEKAPLTNDVSYTQWLIDIIKKHRIDMVIPGIECDMFFWRGIRDLIFNAGAFPLLNNHNLIELCRDKWKFYNILVDNNEVCAIPSSIEKNYNKYNKPFLLKPRSGYGSRGIVKIPNKKVFDIYKDNIGEELFMQPIVGTDEAEYTVSGFFSMESELIDSIAFLRKLSKSGFTVEARVTDYNFVSTMERLAKIFKPIGPTNFQFRLDGDDIKLLEINPRISSATSIRALLGYNESEMSIEYFLNNKNTKKHDSIQIANYKAIRYMEDFIIK